MIVRKSIGVLFLFVLCFTLVSSATIKTTDLQRNERKNFSPGEIAYLEGTGFNNNEYILVQIISPTANIDHTIAVSDNQGNFLISYNFPGLKGDYFIVASDSSDIAKATFNLGFIWITRNNCGTQNQNINQYASEEGVYINADNFNPGNYSWEIRGKPGGASCDPNQIVASGIKTINSSVKTCFKAYNISSNDCGEYQVKFDTKGDNYRIVGNSCEDDESCGEKSSKFICQGLNKLNVTTIPSCEGDKCNVIVNTTLSQVCGFDRSRIFCSEDRLLNLTATPSCADGDCSYDLNLTLITVCPLGCSEGECLPHTCKDKDHDGYNASNNFNLSCGPLDCNDNNPNISPGKTEICNSIDDNCNQKVDDGIENITKGIDLAECQPEILSCINGTFIRIQEKMNSEEEICDGKDNNCNEQVDEGFDQDNDSVGDCFDKCKNSNVNLLIDQDGCDQGQFCKRFYCSPNCFQADFMRDEPKTNPNDCRVIVKDIEGKLYPDCIPILEDPQCVPK
ncbi:MAG: putative metal-binding motif-containing protein [Nanoarchaeota archaeon]